MSHNAAQRTNNRTSAFERSVVKQLPTIKPLPLSWLIQQTTNWWYFSNFARKQDLTFHANCLHRRQFAWNIKSCCLGKIRKAVCWKRWGFNSIVEIFNWLLEFFNWILEYFNSILEKKKPSKMLLRVLRVKTILLLPNLHPRFKCYKKKSHSHSQSGKQTLVDPRPPHPPTHTHTHTHTQNCDAIK